MLILFFRHYQHARKNDRRVTSGVPATGSAVETYIFKNRTRLYNTHTRVRAPRIRPVRAKYAGCDAQKTYDVGGQGVSKTGIFYSFFTRCWPPSTSSDEIRGEGRSYTSLWILKIVTKPSAIVFAFSVQQAACVECGLRQNAYRVQRIPRTPLPYGQG